MEVAKLHRRQFLIGPRPYAAAADWESRELGPGCVLSRCPELRVLTQIDAEGREWTLLGLAVACGGEWSEPRAAIASARSAEVAGRSACWAGRWLLVGDGAIVSDASALLGCYHGRDADGACWASSSPAILACMLSIPRTAASGARSLAYEDGVSWFPPPASGIPGVARLLPSQVLEAGTGRVAARDHLPQIDSSVPFETVLDTLEVALTKALRGATALGAQLWLGLTSGFDSRVMLALAAEAGVEVEAFTRVSSRMSVADRWLPPQLAGACGVPHGFRRAPRRAPPGRPALIDAHTGGGVSVGDAEHTLLGVRDQMIGIMIGGHGFALANGWAGLHGLPEAVGGPERAARSVADFLGEPSRSPAHGALEAWFAWAEQTPCDGLFWQDRFFIEQRQAGWLSAKEQLHDLVPLERLPILNARLIHGLMLSVPREDRLRRRIQLALIARARPALLDFPFNPSDARLFLHRPFHALRRQALHVGRRAGRVWRRRHAISRAAGA
jgi:hypothetical protein